MWIKALKKKKKLRVVSTWILPSSPVLSIRLATFTVFPQMSYCGLRAPITPAITGPWFIPAQTHNQHALKTLDKIFMSAGRNFEDNMRFVCHESKQLKVKDCCVFKKKKSNDITDHTSAFANSSQMSISIYNCGWEPRHFIKIYNPRNVMGAQ